MIILLKVLAVVSWTAAIVCIAIAIDGRLARLNGRWQLVGRSLLYAFAFTPTAYHHAPNTIVAPLQLPTILGNLFYPYDYTPGMFIYGVVVPVVCGWTVIAITPLLRTRRLRPA
jgi:hypothetical protein